jgi:ribonuclease G
LSPRLSWFRRRKKQAEAAPEQAAAPQQDQQQQQPAQPEAGRPPSEAATRSRRRRGTRGGRGRSSKKTEQAGAEAARAQEQPAKAAKPERKPKPSERARRQQSRRRVQQRRAPLPAAKRELVVSVDVGEQRVAVLEDDQVAEVYLERPERRSIAGNIYLGVVDNVLPGMEAAFVEIGLEKNGFLYVDEIVVPELEGKARQGKRIQDLIQRGQTVLVQAVKDPMKTKGARLTTEISLPGRFVVFVPNGEGLGVSRRLPDEERTRLKEIIKGLDVVSGGVIVRTAAEGASAEDVERDLVFLQRLWKTIQARAKGAEAPLLVYQESELPLRVVRDLFTEDFERAYVDHDRTFKRIVGYLKKTSPHMVERVVRYKDKTPLFESMGVEAEIRSTLSRRVDLPSGGYLVFDYAEAFTVIDVNTGRFVGGRGKNSNSRLEDTITKNNLEAVKEVVRQLRLRDIGGIIVIDFIDMANPKNRQAVEEALRTELERDRTKTYVVEISPLGLVEMTRQNVTDGPREILTRRCPACGGDGVVLSETSAAVDVERQLRSLAAGSRVQAFRVEVHPRVLGALVGPGASRLMAIEEQARRRFFLEPAENGHALDHFQVLGQGKTEQLAPQAPVAEGQELDVKLVEVGLHDAEAGVGKVDGFEVVVGAAAGRVGKKVRARVERVLDGTAYAAWLDAPERVEPPITAEGEAEKPTRQPRARKAAAAAAAEAPAADEAAPAAAPEAEAATAAAEAAPEAGEQSPAKKRTRRGTRGGRARKRATPATAAADGEAVAGEAETAVAESGEPTKASTDGGAGADGGKAPRTPRIHVPGDEGDAPGEPPSEPAEAAGAASDDGDTPGAEAATEEKPKKRTRRGTRGGRGRKRKTASGEAATGTAVAEAEVAVADNAEPEAAADAAPDVAPETADSSPNGQKDWTYVPMSEWEDQL